MLEKYHAGDFGHCPRVYCENQLMLPIGIVELLILFIFYAFNTLLQEVVMHSRYVMKSNQVRLWLGMVSWGSAKLEQPA